MTPERWHRRRWPLGIAIFTVGLAVAMAAVPSAFTGADPLACSLSDSLRAPSVDHWFGTDLQGCDYYARTVYGARVSVVVAATFGLIGVPLGAGVGALSAYGGGAVDAILSRVADVWLTVPGVLAAITILTVFPARNAVGVGLAFSMVGWPSVFRVSRAVSLSLLQGRPVAGARALGASQRWILQHYVAPGAVRTVGAYATTLLAVVMVAEASLSYLGVGLRLPAVSWSLMLAAANGRFLSSPHLVVVPSIALASVALSLVYLGDRFGRMPDGRGST